MSTERNKAIVRGYLEMLSRGDLAAKDNFFADDVTFNGQPIAIAQMATFWHRAFPDLHITVEDQVAEGDKVATRVTFRGTHQGEFYGIPATDKEVTWTGTAIDRLVGGKIVEMWHEADELGLLRQLGVHLAAPGSAAGD